MIPQYYQQPTMWNQPFVLPIHPCQGYANQAFPQPN